ncbi:peptide deformylase [Enterococcus columbae]|uniref:Peptide deformylase n=1 Tax=Enterococcus columbae DSM 7374 = ATCC 51263 TaxID=1121865 RepID=S1NGQ2_9ENTE|nr:peptide deformylase [Enterococcus columbae]EOT39078.1 peptide deformylase [Enterococcus columbae DSM 7374 = ATCC 51263]EOW79989.1 peptide deformylase [Enterococcus columbae DSM 7374 = ATCC 51263]OJG23982.1 peptide deformylase [Enterococcus columbae DSM 7374 = ATCC 51263]
MQYPIVLDPDPILRQANQEITAITDELHTLLDDMYETMLANDGVGIAAPQVGKNLQVAIVEVEEGDLFEMINPKIIQKSGEEIDVEGCLSIPHTYGTVKRASQITVSYYDREGEEIEVEAYDFLARAMQHEIDHLNGILFTDKVIDYIDEEELENYYAEEETND